MFHWSVAAKLISTLLWFCIDWLVWQQTKRKSKNCLIDLFFWVWLQSSFALYRGVETASKLTKVTMLHDCNKNIFFIIVMFILLLLLLLIIIIIIIVIIIIIIVIINVYWKLELVRKLKVKQSPCLYKK